MGLFEILLITIVALLVVGPERMPEAVRSVLLTIGRIKRMFVNARNDIEKQIGADEIRQQLHNEAVMDSLAKVKQGLSDIDQTTYDETADMLWLEEDYEKIKHVSSSSKKDTPS